MKKLFLVDAYALIYRSYYAFLNRPMRNAEGMNTSAIFGFVKFLREVMRREQPHYLGVAFDSKGATFRHEMFPDYKANRQQTPEDIHAAVPWIKDILRAMHIPVLEMCGWEADDIIGTMSRHACNDGFEVYMVTPDKDFGQLVNHCVSIYRQRSGGEGIEIMGPREVCEKYGIDDPLKLIDILALWGDASDNIPGVPGVGEKTASKLVAEFGTVEDILARIDEVKGKVKENILANREQLLLSKKLAAIDTDAPVPFEPERLIVEEPDAEALREIYAKLGFTMFMREIEPTAPQGTPRPNGAGDGQDERRELHSLSVGVQPAQQDLFAAGGAQPSLFDSPGGQQDLFTAAESSYDTAETTPHDYILVRDAAEVEALAAELAKAKEFCFDTETTGFDPLTSRLVGVSVAVEPHKAWYIPWREEYVPLLKPVFENEHIAKIGQNLKFDIMVLAQAGIEVRGRLLDTMLLHYLADPEARHGMNHLARAYLNYSPIEIETLIGRGAHQITMDMVPPERVAEYAAEDADITLQLYHKFATSKLYDDIEEPLIRVLADMEAVGVRIDTAILAESGRELAGQAVALEEQIRTLAGDPTLNVNSSTQLGEALFGRMKLDPKPRLTKTRKYRTDEEYLQSLAAGNPIIGNILEYRGLRKLLSTYIDALPALVNPRDGRVHTSFNQAVTATGRLSSSNPNLQNIPIRTAQGREIRRAFIPADSDHLILSADYSQVELRLMAHLSGDENLLGAFRKGEDIHTATASLLFGVPLSEVTPDQRRKAKTANFGIIYGISAFGLSERLGIPRGEAREIIDGYFRSYPGVRAYMDNVIEQARTDGYVTTLFGRRRLLPDIRSGNATVRALAERNAINAPIQGSAADIMKLAMIRTHDELRRRSLRSRMILQVHDELVLDLYKPEQQEVTALVVDAMEHAANLSIPLPVEYGTGTNWLEAH
jgi:DNA polymerase-1